MQPCSGVGDASACAKAPFYQLAEYAGELVRDSLADILAAGFHLDLQLQESLPGRTVAKADDKLALGQRLLPRQGGLPSRQRLRDEEELSALAMRGSCVLL
mmetsp:Transcript_33926/g.107781  ORF Transcript_33926/g.107781 Transcript_33926/m.107781 type:complete len:101 (-) Transcript_33926:3114-3416(-)